MRHLAVAILLVLPSAFGCTTSETSAPSQEQEPVQAAAKPSAGESEKSAKTLEGDDLAIKRCLDAWGTKHPFKGEPLPKYKTLETNVSVMGAGGDLEDKDSTSTAELILVKPAVTVMSKHTLKLLNPNGWYCLKADITVMGKTALEVGCQTRIADAKKGVAVLGSNDEGTGHGVTVLGVTELKRDCPPAAR